MIAFFRETSLQTRKRLFCLFLIVSVLIAVGLAINSYVNIVQSLSLSSGSVKEVAVPEIKVQLLIYSLLYLFAVLSYAFFHMAFELWFGNPKIKELEREISELKVERSKMIINNRKSLSNQN